MIVRCPECSTGFKLPDEQVTEKGVKLRCSKCSHVFRIRRDADGETEFFYNDGDREQNEALAAEADQASDRDDTGQAQTDDLDDNEWDEGESTKLGKPMAAPGKTADDDADSLDEDGNKTHFGMPSSKNEKSGGARKPSKSASSNYNPFPHANLDIQSSKDDEPAAPAEPAEPAAPEASDEPASEPQAASSPQEDELDWGEEATRVEEDAFGDAFDDEPEEDDPFDGAFEDADATAASAQAPAATEAPPAARAPAAAQAPPQARAPAAAVEAAAAGAQAGAQPAQQSPKPSQPDQDSDFWAQKDSAYKPEEMVDPSFGQDGPAFDPEQGVVDNNPAPAQSAPAQSAPAQSAPAAGPPAGAASSPAQAAGPTAPAQTSRSPQQANQQQANQQASRQQSTQNDGGWDVDMVDEPIAPHTVGGSGLQKFANLVLITLLVGAAFLAVVAGLSGGILDLQRFPHMLEVAFEGAEFEPREEWVESAAPAPQPAPEDPVRFEGVFATPASVGKSDQVILVRGNAQNIADVDYSGVVVRGILYDKNERVIAQTTAPIGARVLQSQVAEAGSADAAKGLLPENAKLLSSKTTEPFSLIFTNLPPKVFETQDVIYRVEIADKKTVGGDSAASN